MTSKNTQRIVNRGKGGENIDKKRWGIPVAAYKSSKKKTNKKRVVDPGKYPGSGVQKGSRCKHGKTGKTQKNLAFSLKICNIHLHIFKSSSIRSCN